MAGTTDVQVPSHKVVHALPTKDFFVTMITRDISLKDCIFDLLDNSIDGASRGLDRSQQKYLNRVAISITYDTTQFIIKDNCGGITLSDAIDYAFNFGRRQGSPAEVEGGIGLYGIGMKRAIFKMGKNASVLSEATDACFKVKVDVEAWEQQPHDNWDFEYEDSGRSGQNGTSITIDDLYPEISAAFSDAIFENDLVKSIACDYAFFIDRGLSVVVNTTNVPAMKYQLRESDQVRPAIEQYDDEGVSVRILAGLIDDLPDEVPDEMRPGDVERYGWFVACNDRIVLAGDKTNRTVWGDAGFPVWHGQYNGFAGFVLFHANDQRKLPWTTTKRGLDNANPVYRRAIAAMKRITEEFTKYTNRRKADLDEAKAAEKSPTKVDISVVRPPQPLTLPSFSGSQTRTVRETTATISYVRKKRELDEIRDILGRPAMSNKDIGIHTFEYFRDMELPK